MRWILLSVFNVLVSSQVVDAQEIFDAVRSGDVALVERLISEGAELDIVGPVGTPLHLAALRGDAKTGEALIAGGAAIDAVAPVVGTPLHAAASRGHADFVALLLLHGVSADVRDANDLTPMHFAAAEGYHSIVKTLIDYDADPNAVGRGASGMHSGLGFGQTTALHLAEWNGYDEIADDLKAAGARPEPVKDAIAFVEAGDPQRGQELAVNFCLGCHQLTPDGPISGKVTDGPSLVGVYGRAVASTQDYGYSQALELFGGTWNDDRLFSFLIHPMLTVPGTRMTGMTTEDVDFLADIVAYLKSSSAGP